MPSNNSVNTRYRDKQFHLTLQTTHCGYEARQPRGGGASRPTSLGAVMEPIQHGRHVLCVEPLVLSAREPLDIAQAARARNVVVGIEYHKRFDDRSLIARKRYRAGMLSSLRFGRKKNAN
jgi:hypothetical protein